MEPMEEITMLCRSILQRAGAREITMSRLPPRCSRSTTGRATPKASWRGS